MWVLAAEDMGRSRGPIREYYVREVTNQVRMSAAVSSGCSTGNMWPAKIRTQVGMGDKIKVVKAVKAG